MKTERATQLEPSVVGSGRGLERAFTCARAASAVPCKIRCSHKSEGTESTERERARSGCRCTVDAWQARQVFLLVGQRRASSALSLELHLLGTSAVLCFRLSRPVLTGVRRRWMGSGNHCQCCFVRCASRRPAVCWVGAATVPPPNSRANALTSVPPIARNDTFTLPWPEVAEEQRHPRPGDRPRMLDDPIEILRLHCILLQRVGLHGEPREPVRLVDLQRRRARRPSAARDRPAPTRRSACTCPPDRRHMRAAAPPPRGSAATCC